MGSGGPCGSTKEKVLLVDGKIHVLRPAIDMYEGILQRKRAKDTLTPVIKPWHAISEGPKSEKTNLPHMFWMIPWGKTRKK